MTFVFQHCSICRLFAPRIASHRVSLLWTSLRLFANRIFSHLLQCTAHAASTVDQPGSSVLEFVFAAQDLLLSPQQCSQVTQTCRVNHQSADCPGASGSCQHCFHEIQCTSWWQHDVAVDDAIRCNSLSLQGQSVSHSDRLLIDCTERSLHWATSNYLYYKVSTVSGGCKPV